MILFSILFLYVLFMMVDADFMSDSFIYSVLTDFYCVLNPVSCLGEDL